MHMVNEPDLKWMGQDIADVGWELGASGFDDNLPDAGGAERKPFILKQRESPASQKGILSVLLQDRSFDFLGELMLEMMWSRRAI